MEELKEEEVVHSETEEAEAVLEVEEVTVEVEEMTEGAGVGEVAQEVSVEEPKL
jgi:hypothetical protein